jgi:glutamine synthetase
MLVENVNGLKTIFGDEYEQYASEQLEMIKDVSARIQGLRMNITGMTEARKEANLLVDLKGQALAYCNNVLPFFDKIRYDVDKLELVVDNKNWPLPKYRELLFTK